MDVKDKLEQRLKDTGSLTELAVRNTLEEKADEEQIRDRDDISKDSIIPVSENINKNAIFAESIKKTHEDNINKDISINSEILKNMDKIAQLEGSAINLPKEEITVLASEKNLFITSLVADTRCVLPFTICKSVSIRVRSRTQEENRAIFAYMGNLLYTGQLKTQLDYAAKLRAILLAAQIEQVGEKSYLELKQPLFFVVDGVNTLPPGWLDQVDYWEKTQSPLLGLLFEYVKLFEKKYLTLLENASNQNFW